MLQSIPATKNGSDLIKASAAVSFVASVWVGLRVYSRRMKGVDLHPEDYMIFGALFFLYATLVTMVIAVVDGGYGHHVTDLTPAQIELTLKLTLLTQFWFAAGVGLVKCSICQMLARIFFLPTFRIAAYVIMGFCVGWAVMTCLIGLFICQPISMNWNPQTPGGHCGNENIAFATVGVIDLATDLAILILPLPMIRGLQIPFANKIALVCIFGLGTLTLAIGAVRMSGIFTIDFADFTFQATQTSIWSITEIGTAIVVASSPIIRPLFDRVFHSIVSSRQNNRYTYNNSNAQTLKSTTKASGFDRLGGDEIPLNDIERQGVGVVAIVTAGTSASTNSIDDYSISSKEITTKEEGFDNKIHVKVDTTFYQSENTSTSE